MQRLTRAPRAGPLIDCASSRRRLGAPTLRAALEHVAVMQEAVEHGGDRRYVGERLPSHPRGDWMSAACSRVRSDA